MGHQLHKYEEHLLGKGKVDALVPYLVTGRDGLKYNFESVYSNVPLPLLSGLGNDTMTIPAAQMLTVGGYHWIYFSAQPGYHHYRFAGKNWFPAKTYLARFEQDRISGIAAKDEGGVLMTRAFPWPETATSVLINAVISDGASLSLHLIEENGN